MLDRLNKLKENMASLGLDGLVVTDRADVFYLSGLESSNCLLLISSKNLLLTDSRYILAAQCAQAQFEIREVNASLEKEAGALIKELGLKRVGVQDMSLSLAAYMELSDGAQGQFLPVGELLKEQRAVKDESELDAIRRAQSITDGAFRKLLDYIKPGISETDIACELEYIMRKSGADGLAFETIAAAGINGAKPHAQPGEYKLRAGDMLTLDFGAKKDGYCSDMTRTVSVGEPPEELKKIYTIVLDAHNRAKELLRPGAGAREIDAAARSYIEVQGYGKYFGHGLGHGAGIEIHELPVLSYRRESELCPGNAVTIEPGIYVPGLGGVRIENMCFITESGYEDITRSDNNLIIL